MPVIVEPRYVESMGQENSGRGRYEEEARGCENYPSLGENSVAWKKEVVKYREGKRRSSAERVIERCTCLELRRMLAVSACVIDHRLWLRTVTLA